MDEITENENDVLVALPRGRTGNIVKWNVESGERVYKGQDLALYEESGGARKDLKCPTNGMVTKIIVAENGYCEQKYVRPLLVCGRSVRLCSLCVSVHMGP